MRAYWTIARGRTERDFRAARRHSRVVRFLRIAVPLIAILCATVTCLIVYFNPLRMLAKLPIDVGSMVISGTKITMVEPHMAGFTHDGRAYDFSADRGTQDMKKPDLIELHNLRGKIAMPDKSAADLSAVTGLYDSKNETLRLDQNIVVHSTGYLGRLTEATVDIRDGHVASTRPVVVEMLQGTLNANRLEIIDSGDLVRFYGGVDMVMTLNQTDAVPTGAQAQPASTDRHGIDRARSTPRR
jgi:lipopolysaccharide export system protein LptC